MSKETTEFSEDSIKKKTIPSNKRKVLFWSLLGSGVGVIIIVALLLIFLLPKEEKYEIELSSNVSVEGEVLTGDGSYKKGESITIVAEEITGYRFTGWSFNGNIISTDKEYTFIIGEDTEGEYTANYAKLYTITTSTGNEYGSFIIDKSEAIAGEEVTVDYQINSENQDLHELKRLYYVNMQGEEHTIENNTFTMPEGNVIIYAEFNNLYNINLTTNLADQEVILEGQGIYVENQSTTIKAPKVEGYRFRNWTYNGEIITTNQEYTITKIDNTTKGTYIANYAKLYSISVEDAQNLVTITGNKTEAIEGESVEFSITPNSDYRLISVKVNDEIFTESDGKYTFEMPAEDVTISVTYAEEYAITIDSNSNEYIQIDKQNAIAGESVEFSVSERVGYRIVEVKYNKTTLQSDSSTYTFNMPAEDVTISVTYDELYDILVSSTHGIVTITGNKTQAVESESIEFTITPNSDYRIIEVKVNNDTLTESDGKYTFKMPAGDATISVKYAEEYAITIDTSVSDMVSGVSLDKAISGQQVVVTANIQDTVTDDYVVMSDGLYYIENGSEEKVTINQTGGQYSFTMPANDITIGVEKYRRLDDFTFSGNAITGYTGSATELTLPSHYETVSINSQDYIVEKNTGTQITSIGRYAFASCSNLQTVDFGDNSQLQTIDSYAFSSCRDLTSITIPESVTKIGSSAFYGTNLNDIYYQGTLDQWSDISFANTDWSNCNLYIDDTLVEEITINKNIKTRAFYGITSIKKVTLGENVTSIGYSAFEGCYSLAIVYNNSSLNITTGSSSNGNVGDYAYEVVNAGEEAKGRIEKIDNVSYYINGTTKVALSMIDRSATTVSLEEDTTVINQRAFQNCTNLTSITIPASVTSIGYKAFYNCDNLQTVDFGNNSQLQTIGNFAFEDCTNLTSITIPEGVISIGNSAFEDCTNLTSITIPEGVTSIRTSAFYKCYSLALVINNSDLTITKGSSSNGYVGLYAYEVVNAGEEAQGRIEEIDNVSYYINGTTKVALSMIDRKASSVSLEEDTTAINQWAFDGCTNLTSITIPSSVISIREYAFYRCPSLQTVDFGDNSQLQTIGERAFLNCTSLASITIPESVISIGFYAFSNCTNLQTVDFGDNSQLQTIGERAFQSCRNLTSITIPSNVTLIGSSAFSGCSSLQTVDFGDNSQLQTIGSSAFFGCDNLQTVDFGDNSQLQTIGSSAFYSAFYGITSLKKVTLGESVTSIGSSAFNGCYNLTSVTIESDDIYVAANGIDYNQAGKLLANATTVKVLTTIVNTCDNSYLENTSNFTTSTDGEYTVFTKKV